MSQNPSRSDDDRVRPHSITRTRNEPEFPINNSTGHSTSLGASIRASHVRLLCYLGMSHCQWHIINLRSLKTGTYSTQLLHSSVLP
jgi:hypothetical protein